MKIFKLPAKIKALIFDMDLTIYENAEYGQYQIDSLVERLGKHLGISFEEMKAGVKETRKAWACSHSGKEMSLSNVLQSYCVSMEQNVAWRREIYEPGRFLKEDERLRDTLEKLLQFYVQGIVTNNPVLVARKTLAALGVTEYFPILVGLDTCMIAKPHKTPFLKFSELSQCPPETCVSIGDRYDIDLDIPLELGMGGILVDGVEDVYCLPDVLAKGH